MTIEEWLVCPLAAESSRDELVFTTTAGGKRVAMRHPRCGHETAFRETGPPTTWVDVLAAVVAHLPERAPDELEELLKIVAAIAIDNGGMVRVSERALTEAGRGSLVTRRDMHETIFTYRSGS